MIRNNFYFSIELTGCIDTRALLILRIMITLICLAIISSTIGFVLDALGAMKYSFRCMRRYAFWHILSSKRSKDYFIRFSIIFLL